MAKAAVDLEDLSEALQDKTCSQGAKQRDAPTASLQAAPGGLRNSVRADIQAGKLHGTCRHALRAARGLSYQQRLSCPMSMCTSAFGMNQLALGASLGRGAAPSAAATVHLSLRATSSGMAVWLRAFEAATLPGIPTVDPWDLAPGVEAVADMLMLSPKHLSRPARERDSSSRRRRLNRQGGTSQDYTSEGQYEVAATRVREKAMMASCLDDGASGLPLIAPSERWLATLGKRTADLLASEPGSHQSRRQRHLPLPTRGPQLPHPPAEEGTAAPSPVTLQHLVQLAVAAARLGCTVDTESLKRCTAAGVGRLAPNGLRNLPPGHLADLAWSLARLGYRTSVVTDAAFVSDGLDPDSRRPHTQPSLTSIVPSQASTPTAQLHPDEDLWIRAFLEASHAGLPCMQPTHLIRCLEALVLMGIKPYDLWLRCSQLLYAFPLKISFLSCQSVVLHGTRLLCPMAPVCQSMANHQSSGTWSSG